jgi:hypothetical protein
VAELRRALVRFLVAFGLFGFVSQLPWPAQAAQWIALVTGGACAVIFLIICGTLLYNTLFYDHYWRSIDSR